jgi:hypothetical protein
MPTAACAWALLLLIAIGPARSAATVPGPCPASLLQAYKGGIVVAPIPTHAFVYDTTVVLENLSTVHLRFDRFTGQVEFTTNTSRRIVASARIIESFDVVGVPQGAAVDGVLEFRLDGWVQDECGGSGCGVFLRGVLASGVDSVQAGGFFGPSILPRPFAATLHLPIHLVAGTPVEAHVVVSYETNVGAGSGGTEVSGSYDVTGLPPGVRAIACPGCDVTPARRSTWGTLKRFYR